MNRAWALIAVLAATAACESEVLQPSGGSGSGANDAGGQSAGGENAGGENTGASNTGGAGACAAFHDSAEGEEIRIVLRNDSALEVYVPANCGGTFSFSIQSQTDPEAAAYGNFDGYCLQTCEDLQTEGLALCEPCAPQAVRIAAFESVSVGWRTNGLRSVEMPAACFLEPFGSDPQTCGQRTLAEAGPYQMEAITPYLECPGCECGPEGICFGTPAGTQGFSAPLDFALPAADDHVEYVIDACAFGCPDG